VDVLVESEEGADLLDLARVGLLPEEMLGGRPMWFPGVLSGLREVVSVRGIYRRSLRDITETVERIEVLPIHRKDLFGLGVNQRGTMTGPSSISTETPPTV
jgi:hypothetical protein